MEKKINPEVGYHGTYADMHHDFVRSDHGRFLEESIRFERFKPLHLTNDQWRELLGADVDGAKHMPLTYGMTKAFIRHYQDNTCETDQIEPLSEQDEHILQLAAITNNWGVVRTGDISYDQKTLDIKQEEKDAYREIFEELQGNRIDVKTRMLVERTVFDEQSRLGQMFDAVRRVGYLRTGLQAFKMSREVSDAVTSEHLQWLCANVLSNQTITLIEYSKSFPAVRTFLEKQHVLISEAFDFIQADVFHEHGQTESIRPELLWQNKSAWHEFNLCDAEDLKLEIIQTALEAITEQRSSEEAEMELDQLLDSYRQVIASRQSSSSNEVQGIFDRGLFGNTSNIEKRLITDYEQLHKKVEAIRELGLRIVLTSGSFDLLHVGHAAYLEKAKQEGDVLIVGVDSDEKVGRKGPDRPMVPDKERTELLSHLRGVDMITVKPSSEVKWELIKLIQPDTLVTTQETYTEKEIAQLRRYCQRIVTLPPQASTSTSAKIRRIHMGFGQKLLQQAELSINQSIAQGGLANGSEIRTQILSILEEALEEVARNE